MRRRALLSSTILGLVDPNENQFLCSMASAPPGMEGGNNGGGNSSEPPAQGNQNNNGGQDFQPESFWDDPVVEAPSPPSSGNSAGNDSPATGSPPNQQQNGLGNQLQSHLAEFKFGEPMDKEAIESIGAGDYGKFNENFNKALRGAVEESVKMNVQVLGAAMEQMQKKFQTMLESHSQNKDNYSALYEAIPSSKNPKVAPIIQGIYDRALTMAKGNVPNAINMTKHMMSAMSKETSADTGLNVAPTGADSESGFKPSTVDWLEELNQP